MNSPSVVSDSEPGLPRLSRKSVTGRSTPARHGYLPDIPHPLGVAGEVNPFTVE